MVPIIYYILSLFFQFSSPEKIRLRNEYLDNFKKYYQEGDYSKAIIHFESLESLGTPISSITKFNAAQCMYLLGDYKEAEIHFSKLTNNGNANLAARASNMSAKILLDKKDTLKAIQNLKNALLNFPQNEELLFNYEFLKKKFKNNKPPPPPSKTSQKEKDENKGGVAEKSNQKDDELDSSTPPKINRDQALQLLEALKEKEIYFIPQKSKTDTAHYGKW